LSGPRFGFRNVSFFQNRFAIHRLDEERLHCGLMPAALMTLPQVSYSRFV
jgi:hypothetical protein